MFRSDIRRFRTRSKANGYEPIRVRDHDKRPVVRDWTKGEPDVSLVFSRTGSNTGILAAGLRAIDIDIENLNLVQGVIREIGDRLPRGPLIRRRSNSSRLLVLYRAAVGKPGKLKVTGPAGAVEVLGDGQQFVAHGVHPSGAEYEWHRGKSPASVPVSALGTVTEEALLEFLAACESLLEGSGSMDPTKTLAATQKGNITPLHHSMGATTPITCGGNRPTDHVQDQRKAIGIDVTQEGKAAAQDVVKAVPPSVTSMGNLPKRLNPNGEAKRAADELSAGIEGRHWFSKLQPHVQEKLVRTCLSAIDNTKDDPRDRWLRILFAVADAERQGCPNARALALEWSKSGPGWTSEVDFDTAFGSAKAGGVSVGTLLHAAEMAGLDLSSFRIAADEPPLAEDPAAQDSSTRRSGVALLSELVDIPPKRKFLHGTDVVRGAVTILVAPGGRGKTSFLAAMALACASDRPLLGQKIFGGPHRVLFINGEDSIHELNRRFTAAIMHYGLKRAALANLAVIGAEAGALNLVQGDKGQYRLNPSGWQELLHHLDEYHPDIVFMDPYSKLYGGVSTNDNAAATLVMGEFTRVAAERDLAFVAAHHASKNTDVKNAEAAMGGAMTMNLARVGLSIEPISQSRAPELGISPMDAASYFELHHTKQNMAAASSNGRLCRLVSVILPNAEPPVYPEGDKVAVVEPFQPSAAGSAYPPAMIQAVLAAIVAASPPLSPRSSHAATDPIPVIEGAMGPYMGGRATAAAAKALLKYLLKRRTVVIGKFRVPRAGRGAYPRDALFVPNPSGPKGTP